LESLQLGLLVGGKKANGGGQRFGVIVGDLLFEGLDFEEQFAEGVGVGGAGGEQGLESRAFGANLFHQGSGGSHESLV